MRLHIIFSLALILLACSYQGALAQQSGEGICPVISVSQVEAASTGPTLIYKANVQGGNPSVTPKFNWRVWDGKITSGQGAAEVSVEPDRSKSFTVTVEVTGYASNCPNAASYTSIVHRLPSRKFDEYGDMKFSEERRRLDQFAFQLHNEPQSKGYIIVYEATDSRKSLARGERAKNYLVKERGFQEAQIVVVNGGHRNKRAVELFVTPFGALPPTATPK